MIVRITFDDGSVMLFGNSYKFWTMQFDEYMWRKNKDANSKPIKDNSKPVRYESCRDEWIGWGGLKWCPESFFQQELNREGCQHDDPDNPRPRQYSKMEFIESKYVKNKALKILNG